ncbi:MAG: hypothetical protein QM758_00530 [Armatimonas sp.]
MAIPAKSGDYFLMDGNISELITALEALADNPDRWRRFPKKSVFG